MTHEPEPAKMYELVGPVAYSPAEIAGIFGHLWNLKVVAQQIPPAQWEETLQKMGFSDSATDHLIKMIEAVIDGKVIPELEQPDRIKLPITFEKYVKQYL